MKHLRISVEGKTYDVEVELLDEGACAPTPKAASTAGGSGSDVSSPLAAVVVSIDVAVGDAVTEGQAVITLEAMKMNTIVSASCTGTVGTIHVKAGDAVEEGQAMVTIS